MKKLVLVKDFFITFLIHKYFIRAYKLAVLLVVVVVVVLSKRFNIVVIEIEGLTSLMSLLLLFCCVE